MDESFADVFGSSSSDDGSDFEGFTVDEIGLNSEVDDDLGDLVGVDVLDALNESDDDDMIVDGGARSSDGDDDDVESDTDSEADDEEWSKDLHSTRARAFSGPPPGPTTKLNRDASVLDYFLLFFPLTLIQHLVQETNLYAAQKRQANQNLPQWKPVSVEEMKIYFGIRLYLSIVPFPEMRMLWSTDEVYGGLRIAKFMTLKRFEEISGNFHANDRTQHLPKEHPNHDKLHLIRPVLDEVLAKCLQRYNPHPNCSVDEAMIAFRGRLGFRQYLPNKPTKYGVKVWMRADPVNGYCNEFKVYTGRERENRPDVGLSARVVTGLTTCLRGMNYVINMDNFFTSVDLFESLLQEDISARGTVRINRRGLPRTDLSEPRLTDQGTCNTVQRGRMSAYAWKDKRVVNLLSSSDDPTATTTVDRKQHDGTKKVVPCPVALHQYNAFMGGVDRADQVRSQYPTARTSHRWWVYVFWFLFDVAVANAFILMKESEAHQRRRRNGRPKRKLLPLLEFRKKLSKKLLGCRDGQQNRRRHVIMHGPTRRRCQGCRRDRNRRCETKTYCVRCDVVMCSKSFSAYHGWK